VFAVDDENAVWAELIDPLIQEIGEIDIAVAIHGGTLGESHGGSNFGLLGSGQARGEQ